MYIVAVIATKNRIELFDMALYSVISQIRRPDDVIVVSDSEPSAYSEEERLCRENGIDIIRDRYTRNYAGSLNTAMHEILGRHMDSVKEIGDIYVAFLDDDDTWSPDYLAKCEAAAKSREDFVVTGLRYFDGVSEQYLSIPENLDIRGFLIGNPHIQGSNTFVKMKTLLKAGLFDENLPSTTDRDIFVRIMLLNPTYCVVNEHLVRSNAANDRQRITNSPVKSEGLRKFYRKYSGLMTEEDKTAFWDRAERLFNTEKDDLPESPDRPVSVPAAEYKGEKYTGRLIVGFIVTDRDAGLRLLVELAALEREKTRIVIFENFEGSDSEFEDIVSDAGYSHVFFRADDVRDELTAEGIVSADTMKGSVIRDISVARAVLHHVLYNNSTNGDVIWILDEDMELKSLVRNAGQIEEYPSDDIDRVIAEYRDRYDAVVGCYAADPPLPFLSTVRCSLLDYFFNGSCGLSVDCMGEDRTDYYYDLSESNTRHLETPVKFDREYTLDDIFAGKATGRPLVEEDFEPREARSRGGNTIVFDRELLKIPNVSVTVDGMTARRGDYFWVILAKATGKRVAQVPFAVEHNRNAETFSYDAEAEKLIKDIIGSSFTRAYEAVSPSSLADAREKKDVFCEAYESFFRTRLVKYTASFYRTEGLLESVGDAKYLPYFTEERLSAFLWKCRPFTDREEVTVSYMTLLHNLFVLTETQEFGRKAEKVLSDNFILSGPLKKIGSGGEGIVYGDGVMTYKVFYKPHECLSFLEDIMPLFPACPALAEISLTDADGFAVVKREYESGEAYSGGHAGEIAAFLKFCRDNGFVYDNFKKENLIVTASGVKIIDYGDSFKPYTDVLFEKTVKRAYELIKYGFLSEVDFRRMVRRSHNGETDSVDCGWENLMKLAAGRTKEDIHDGNVIEAVEMLRPSRILDYGAGKCRIAGALSEKYDVTAYDIDSDTLMRYAGEKVKIVKDLSDPETAESMYDTVICNLVLCCVDDGTAESIMRNISSLLSVGGHAVLSLCDPFFAGVPHTETRLSGTDICYGCSGKYTKKIKKTGKVREEYFRPAEFYENLFGRFGFSVEYTRECGSVDPDTLLPVSEYLIYVLKLERKPAVLSDCALVISADPMDADLVYGGIRHIVLSLEKGISFRERIVVADMTDAPTRARAYAADNPEKLRNELERAKSNGLIDRIIYAEDDEDAMRRTYNRFFGLSSSDGHSVRGQGTYASLLAFEDVSVRYIFRTDCDILYSAGSFTAFGKLYSHFVSSGAVTASPSIAGQISFGCTACSRTEVRAAFIDREKLFARLPLENSLSDGKFTLGWHRALDRAMLPEECLRYCGGDFYFAHPGNEQKRSGDIIPFAMGAFEKGKCPGFQNGCVELRGNEEDWVFVTYADTVIYTRGRNTSCEKLKRLFDSIAAQTVQNFTVVYIDDASSGDTAEYLRQTLGKDERFVGRSVFVSNGVQKGEIANFVFAMTHIIKNPDAVVINIDSDDCFADKRAVEYILNEFEAGADLTCGNCVRADRPLKKYKVESFDNVWERSGDNIWLHPKCFRRYLFDRIDAEKDLKYGGEYVDVNTDFAFMLPMIEYAKKCVFIDRQIYLYEPSSDGSVTGEAKEDRRKKVKEYILDLAKRRHIWNTQGEK